MKMSYRNSLMERINRKDWWHVPPSDPEAYEKRGKFLASTFREAEFWGRPLDAPVHVNVKNPLIGDEKAIETELMGGPISYPGDEYHQLPEWRWEQDAKLKEAALAKGYDSIVILSARAYAKFLSNGSIPLSIELNLLAGDGR